MLWIAAIATMLSGAGTAADAAVKVKNPAAAVVVYGAQGAPLFRANLDYILSAADNSSGKIFATDPSLRRVRVSRDGTDEYWLSCDQLEPIVTACPTQAPPTAATATRPRSAAVRGGGIPNCPGDPRCPRLPSK